MVNVSLVSNKRYGYESFSPLWGGGCGVCRLVFICNLLCVEMGFGMSGVVSSFIFLNWLYRRM